MLMLLLLLVGNDCPPPVSSIASSMEDERPGELGSVTKTEEKDMECTTILYHTFSEKREERKPIWPGPPCIRLTPDISLLCPLPQP